MNEDEANKIAKIIFENAQKYLNSNYIEIIYEQNKDHSNLYQLIIMKVN